MRYLNMFLIVLFLSAAFPAKSQTTLCVVSDPTGTPLNVRTAPNGKILGNVRNGVVVTVVQEISGDNGVRWAFMNVDGSAPQGWVFRRFLVLQIGAVAKGSGFGI